MCSKKMLGQGQTTTRRLHDDLIFDEILTRLPPAAAVRCRAVCRAWRTALTSDDFVRAYAAARSAAAARAPEVLFFAPAAATATATTLTLYACALLRNNNNGAAGAAAAREVLTLGNLSAAAHAVVSPRPCHGLTLVSDGPASRHYVCNLSTGEHAALPPCERAAAAAVEPWRPMRAGVTGLRRLRPPPWTPFELASTGLGFDPATGEHKAVRLFRKPIGETACQVCTPAMAAAWRPCSGRVPLAAASFIPGLPPVSVAGSLYWLLELDSFTGTDQPVMSFSVGGEQFGWARMPPRLARRVGTLTELDGALCAVVDLRFDSGMYGLLTWSASSAAWSMRCSISLQSLPPAVSDELVEEDDVVPLCTTADGRLLLATGFHKVFAYDDPKRGGGGGGGVERVFYMQEFVDVPAGQAEAQLLLNIGLYKDSIASVQHFSDSSRRDSRLQVKLGGTNTLCKRQGSRAYRNHHSRFLRDFFVKAGFAETGSRRWTGRINNR